MSVPMIRNPYNYSSAVRQRDLFAGRDGELDQIAYFLSQVTMSTSIRYMALYGERAAGKTSLLRMAIDDASGRDIIAVQVELVATDVDTASFFAKLYEELVNVVLAKCPIVSEAGIPLTMREVRRMMNGGPVSHEWPLEFPETLAALRSGAPLSELALRSDMAFFAQRVERPILIAIDEAQIISENREVLAVIRAIGQRLEGYAVIFTGTPGLINQISTVAGHVLRQFELIEVKGFSEGADVLNCICLPLASIGLDPGTHIANIHQVVNDIWGLSDGNPQQVQLIMYMVFEKWQREQTDRMSLSPKVLDDVRAMLEIGDHKLQRKFTAAVNKMVSEEVIALNTLCGMMGHADFDLCWFVYTLGGRKGLTRQQLNEYKNKFIEEGIIEVSAGTISAIGDMYDWIYLRILTATRFRQAYVHQPVISSNRPEIAIARQLDNMMCEFGLFVGQAVPTCCLGMHDRHLNRAIAVLQTVPDEAEYPFCVTYLHQVLVKLGLASMFYLVEVRCRIGDAEGVRWYYSATDPGNWDENNADFMTKRAEISTLGGDLSTQTTMIQLASWGEMVAWVVANSPSEVRSGMADTHAAASVDSYRAGDLALTMKHLDTAMQFAPSWMVANNRVYLAIAQGAGEINDQACLEAVELAPYAQERALSRYNRSIFLMQKADYDQANVELDEVIRELDRLPRGDVEYAFLVVPRLDSSVVKYGEKTDAGIRAAAQSAKRVANLARELSALESD